MTGVHVEIYVKDRKQYYAVLMKQNRRLRIHFSSLGHPHHIFLRHCMCVFKFQESLECSIDTGREGPGEPVNPSPAVTGRKQTLA